MKERPKGDRRCAPDSADEWFAEGGAVSATTTYLDYREVGVMRVPHRDMESAETSGPTIHQGERVEVGATLAPDAFTRPPSTTSGRGR
jgi:hypothetical protein